MVSRKKTVAVPNGGPLRDLCVENSLTDNRARMNWNIPLLPQKRTRTAFKSNFVNRGMKPPIITEKTDIRINGAPFAAVPSIVISDI